MNGLSPMDRERLLALDAFTNRLHHVRGLVERLAVERGDPDSVAAQCRRAFNQLKMQLTTAGLDTMANMCTGLEATARRGMQHGAKVRALREGVGNLTRAIDVEKRHITTAAKRSAEAEKKE